MLIRISSVILVLFCFYVISYALWKSYIFIDNKLFVLIRYISIVILIFVGFLFILKKHLKKNKFNNIILVFMSYILIKGLIGQMHINEFIYLFLFPISLLIMEILSEYVDLKKLYSFFWCLIFVFIFIFAINYVIDSHSIIYTGQLLERGIRYTFGFSKPSYVAEYIMILIFFASFITINLNKKLILIILLFLLYLLYLTGSRDGLLSILVFFMSLKLNIKNIKIRFLILLIIFIMFFLFYHYLMTLDFEKLNKISSGRLFIWTSEINHNINSIKSFLFGQSNPTVAFHYTTNRLNSIYHLDSFFVEFFIKEGLIGIVLIVFLIFSLYKISNKFSKAIILASTFYGVFEGPIFSIISLFGFCTLLLIFISNKQMQGV